LGAPSPRHVTGRRPARTQLKRGTGGRAHSAHVGRQQSAGATTWRRHAHTRGLPSPPWNFAVVIR
jgi:hypothetical protein